MKGAALGGEHGSESRPEETLTSGAAMQTECAVNVSDIWRDGTVITGHWDLLVGRDSECPGFCFARCQSYETQMVPVSGAGSAPCRNWSSPLAVQSPHTKDVQHALSQQARLSPAVHLTLLLLTSPTFISAVCSMLAMCRL